MPQILGLQGSGGCTRGKPAIKQLGDARNRARGSKKEYVRTHWLIDAGFQAPMTTMRSEPGSARPAQLARCKQKAETLQTRSSHT